MASDSLVAMLRGSVAEWNQWRSAHPQETPNLAGASLTGANLRGAELSDADLTGAYLREADLTGAILVRANLAHTSLRGAEPRITDLHGAKLVGAKLAGSNLSGASLRSADLCGADLRGADLRNVTFGRTNLDEANLTGARMGRTTFADIDLRHIKGLEAVRHYGPSTIGIDTIFRSGGEIPDAFLRGCGVPDNFIKHRATIVRERVDVPKCFISFSHHDQDFSDRLHADLQARGVPTWYFPKDAQPARPILEEIDRAIMTHDKVIVIFSEHSINSLPVLREIELALGREEVGRPEVVIPIRIDDWLLGRDASGKPNWNHRFQRLLASRVAVDFRDWNKSTAKYDAAFEGLLKVLESAGF